MKKVDVARMDLNLLKVFIALLEEGSVTAAGSRLGLTQPTMSHALARLRESMDDPMFVRTSAGMMPTRYSETVAGPVRRALATIQGALDEACVFDAKLSDRNFTLLMTELGEAGFMPDLVDYVHHNAPHVRLTAVQLPRAEYYSALESGRAEIGLGVLPPGHDDIFQLHLNDVQFRCCFRKGHPIENNLSFSSYLQADHLVVGPPSQTEPYIKRALGTHASQRRILLQLPRNMVPPAVLAKTDLIAILPAIAAENLVSTGLIVSAPCPFPIEPLELRQFWHERTHHDSGCRWLRQVIAKLFRKSNEDGSKQMTEHIAKLSPIRH